MSLYLPPLYLLQLHFRTLAPIHNLPHFHGPQWNGMFRTLLHDYLPSGLDMAGAGIWIHPIETGVIDYDRGDPIVLGMTFPTDQASPLCGLLSDFNTLPGTIGHFQPGRTIQLESIVDRVSDITYDCLSIKESRLTPLSMALLQPEMETLGAMAEFIIRFRSPLRLRRPGDFKTEGHRWADPDFFLSEEAEKGSPLNHLIKAVNLPSQFIAAESLLEISGGALTLVDNKYGRFGVPLGGVMGTLRVTGKPSHDEAMRLAAGQYVGVGKNRAFGLGFYDIPELSNVTAIRLLSRGNSLMARAMDLGALKSSLTKIPNSSPGPDGLSKEDLVKAGKDFLERMSVTVREGSYSQGELKTYRHLKKDGGFREILVQNVSDRVVQRAIADMILPSVEKILSASTYAYRKGLNRQGAGAALQKALSDGYTVGFKADISSFFPSVNVNILCDLLNGLYPADILPEFILNWLKDMEEAGLKGLPQGSPLSPVLSNLYLDRFDKKIESLGFRLIRYGDDFIVLVQEGGSPEEIRQIVESSLSSLGLRLSPQKIEILEKAKPIKFLGYLITPEEISIIHPEAIEAREEWLPVFRDEWLSGRPVYLSSICRGAYSTGPDLSIQIEGERKELIPWNRVSRIVIVGRSSFSGGVIYRAVREEIPVSFIDVWGMTRGQLYPSNYDQSELTDLQKEYAGKKDFCLQFAKEVIAASIHNRAVILRRNSFESSELRGWIDKVAMAKDLDSLRGCEGTASRIFFESLSQLVHPFEFKSRTYHPPEGPINVMLSLGYTLLYNRIASVLLHKAYNPRIGFYHQGRGRHAALASDLIEQLRHLVERVVLALIHNQEIKPEDFSQAQAKNSTLWRLSGEGFRKFIHRFEHTMSIPSGYHGGEKTSTNAYLDEMADNLKRTLKLKIPYKALRIQ